MAVAVAEEEEELKVMLNFDDGLKDLKSLRPQLYSAAEHFEVAYALDGNKLVDSLKDYAVSAIVDATDHLRGISVVINSLVDQQFVELTAASLRLSCAEQRVRTCRELMSREGLSQQTLRISIPKYHLRYTLPAGAIGHAVPTFNDTNRTSHETVNHRVRDAHAKPKDKQASFRKSTTLSRTRSEMPHSNLLQRSQQSWRIDSPTPSFRGDKGLQPASPDWPRQSTPSARPPPHLLRSATHGNLNSAESRKLPASFRLHAERDSDRESERAKNAGMIRRFLRPFIGRHWLEVDGQV